MNKTKNNQEPVFVPPIENKIALIGRSNVGKSSIINLILGRRDAKISKNPGRTRKHISHKINDNTEIVDLPGYGYAKVSKERRLAWDDLLLKLIFEDKDFKKLLLIIDISIKPMDIDKIFIKFLIDKEVNFTVVFNKSDKEKEKDINANIVLWEAYFKAFLGIYKIEYITISAKLKRGVENLKKLLIINKAE